MGCPTPAGSTAGFTCYGDPCWSRYHPNRVVSLESDVFPGWVHLGLGGYTTLARFIDIGTPESYAEAGTVMAEITAGCGNAEICLGSS